ncbi:MAG: hypothetical protein K0R90_1145 [Oscillospiraceae bacterium]|nr:hypothetical protein [Oscillospiraceae bacterium]
MKQWFIRTKASILLLFCLLLIPVSISADSNVPATLLSLEQIEPLIINGPEVLAALSAISRDEALEVLARQKAGAKYFGGVNYGYSNEPKFDTSEDKNKYNKLSITGGLNFPLLGTLQKEKIGKLEAEIAALESKHYASMLSLNNLVVLRKAYTTLWIEQQKEEVAKRFLNTEEETTHILQRRQAQGLVLPVDRLEFLSVYHDVRRDMTASKLHQMQALKILGVSTGRTWDLTEKLKAPSFPSIEGKKIDLTTHPEVVYQHNLVSQQEKLLAETKRIEREANLTIGLNATRDFPGSTGNGAYIAFSMTEPIKSLGSKDQAKLAAGDELSRAKKEETVARLKLNGQVEEALATAAYAAADVNARASHLIVMAESIREKMLRRMVLPGDTFEQLQHSKSQYYRTAMDMLDQEKLFLQSVIDITSYVYPRGLGSELTERVFSINENDSKRTKLLAPNWLDAKNIQDDMSAPLDFSDLPNLKTPIVTFESAKKIPADRIETRPMLFETVKSAIYVWNAAPFLQSNSRTEALNEISDAGFSRMILSFTPKQVSQLVSPTGKKELNALIVEAKGKGLRIDLMLGDPTWAEADHRGELLTLIKQLQKFDFDGLHLDIEPDSLPGAAARRAELLEGLTDTITAVKQITKLPVSLSIHPRYLEGDLGVLAREKLLPLGLEEIVVMIYSDNPHATTQRMSAIITANPNVPFSLAQSVERNIPLAESYADSTRQEFKDAMHLLEDNLASYGLKGIFIQAWEDYKKGEAQ